MLPRIQEEVYKRIGKLYTNKEWEERNFTPFYYNVQKDGISIN